MIKRVILICNCADMESYAKTSWQVLNVAEKWGEKDCPRIVKIGTPAWDTLKASSSLLAPKLTELTSAHKKFAQYWRWDDSALLSGWNLLKGEKL